MVWDMTSLAGPVNQVLGEQILAGERSRSRRWRVQFMLAWLVIVAALVAFVLITINLDTQFIAKWLPFILTGVPVTIFVSFASITLAVILAVLGALGRLSVNPYVNGLASFYVSFFRGTPLLLQIVFIYFALPQMGLVLPEIPTGIIALGFNYGAYMTEVFRSGIQAVPHGQTEAALSLGMSGGTTFRRIIVPQAFRIVTPAIGNDFIAMLKDSSLVSVISVHELLYQAQVAGRPNHKSMQTLLIAAMVYWILTIAFSFFQARLERRQAVGDRSRRPGSG
ncbi:MAG: amino acid ABC transporter permease [Chloroflexi bacterium]|nr:MAG: amino acid ABC transporter permease [Chloroflexota bacterium]